MLPNEIKTIIANTCEPVLSVDDLNSSDTLSELGIDSLKMIHLVLELEEVAGERVFVMNRIESVRTVGDLLSALNVENGE